VPCLSPLSLETPFSCFPLFSPFSLGRLLVEAAPLDFLENTFPLEQALEGFDRFFYVAVVDVYVQSRFCLLGSFPGCHFDKPEAFAFNNVHIRNFTMLCKKFLQLLLVDRITQIANKQFGPLHCSLPFLVSLCLAVFRLDKTGRSANASETEEISGWWI
jgi:hypothetical protein